MATTTLTTRQRVGIALGGLIALSTIPSGFFATPEGDVGPPVSVLVLDSLLGALGVVAAVLAWRGSRGAIRVLAAALVLNALSGVPAFFVDVPVGIKALVGVSVLLTVAIVVLLFSGRTAPRTSGAVA